MPILISNRCSQAIPSWHPHLLWFFSDCICWGFLGNRMLLLAAAVFFPYYCCESAIKDNVGKAFELSVVSSESIVFCYNHFCCFLTVLQLLSFSRFIFFPIKNKRQKKYKLSSFGISVVSEPLSCGIFSDIHHGFILG